MCNLTSKDKDGKILLNGEFKICNVATRCYGNYCPDSCIINVLIERLYELEHRNDSQKERLLRNRMSK